MMPPINMTVTTCCVCLSVSSSRAEGFLPCTSILSGPILISDVSAGSVSKPTRAPAIRPSTKKRIGAFTCRPRTRMTSRHLKLQGRSERCALSWFETRPRMSAWVSSSRRRAEDLRYANWLPKDAAIKDTNTRSAMTASRILSALRFPCPDSESGSRRQRTRVGGALFLEEVGDQEGKLDRLLGVEPRIAEGVVAVG